MIKDLRERTGAGMSDCKKALLETDGDTEKASEFLRKKGLAAAAKKGGRIATEGAITSYIHNGRVGVLLEVNCETDFVAKTEDFQRFIKDVAMHIAGAHPAPLVVAEADMDPAAIEKEREIRIEAAKNPKQVPGEKLKVIPEAMIPKVVEGQIAKWKKDVAYGNIGGATRLDFTCIGPAVNLASRIEGLTGRLGKRLLVSDAFARATTTPLRPVGTFELKGVAGAATVHEPA